MHNIMLVCMFLLKRQISFIHKFFNLIQIKQIRETEDFIFDGRDGTFQDRFNSSIVPPKDCTYCED